MGMFTSQQRIWFVAGYLRLAMDQGATARDHAQPVPQSRSQGRTSCRWWQDGMARFFSMRYAHSHAGEARGWRRWSWAQCFLAEFQSGVSNSLHVARFSGLLLLRAWGDISRALVSAKLKGAMVKATVIINHFRRPFRSGRFGYDLSQAAEMWCRQACGIQSDKVNS